VVFKRRTKRSYLRIVLEAVYPKGGWGRAFQYVQHRVRRLPDSPHRIARGIFAGVFTSFTPFFGLHFLISALIAKTMRGNILASLLATFVGNPLTFPFIGLVSMKLGRWMLGTTFREGEERTLLAKFLNAGRDLKHNAIALFTDRDAHWTGLSIFYRDVFLPYLVGGLIPGILAGMLCYYLSEPVIAAYQKRRRKKLTDRFEKLRARVQARKEEAREKR
jgi:uncharacterized protein (DUF2062 family)